MVNNMYSIETKKLTKKFKDKIAVNGIDLNIKQGELFALLGTNGAGKTTTIKMLSGLILPTSGSIKILDMDMKKDIFKIKEILNVSPQETAIAPNLTVKENLEFMAGVYQIKDKDKKINELIKMFKLDEVLNKRSKTLSGGWQRKVSIAISLINDPKILFLDEPTIGLDPVVKENIRVLIKRLNKEKKTTIFLTSLDVGDIEKLCKRVIIVNDGKIVLDDTMENLKYHYLNKKIVEVKMKEQVNLDDEDGIVILKDKGYNLKIEVDTTKRDISDVINLLDTDKIIDINISNIPLEDIISSIYKGDK